jgi:signal transduction histidine kinase
MARRGITQALEEEREHELCAALLGIEASAAGLSRHREQLTDEQFDALALGLLAEVRRVRAMLRGCRDAHATFDLLDCLAPLVACATASGLDVRCSVRPGIAVEGTSDTAAQVVVALLDNARRHAASSPVEIRADVVGADVHVLVEDRGAGIPGPSPERVFERGVQGAESTGSGLGLFIARRLMAEQGGSIDVGARRGGGTSFRLRFRSAARR